jgi:circadian clock protein KaiC
LNEEEQEIELLVVDGLTAIRNAIDSERRFREFMHGLMAFTKRRLMTTFMCYEHPEIFGISRFMPDAGISSIVDNIILLSFVELGERMHRAITIAKTRGCNHALTTCEYTIGPGGLALLPKDRIATPAMSFGNYPNLLSRSPTRFPREGRNLAGDTDSKTNIDDGDKDDSD